MNHLKETSECMEAREGDANTARKIVKSIKDKKRIADNPELVKERNQIAYKNNPDPKQEQE